MEREGKVLPEATEQALVRQEAEVRSFFQEIEEEFIDKKVTKDKADHSLKDTEERIRFEFNKVINELEMEFIKSQKRISKDLNNEYQIHIKSMFQNCKDLDLPILEGIRQSVLDISLNLVVQHDEIKTRSIVVGTELVSDRTWYKPWTWTKKKEIYKYSKEEYVDLQKLWQTREKPIRDEFTSLMISARNRIFEGKDVLVNQYLIFMSQEFDRKFKEILTNLQEKLNDQKERESTIKEAHENLKWIENFKARLDETLLV